MKTITLNRMELRNFKGASEAEYDFNADHTTISGDNATGKSTIFDAYLWCLFDKNQQGTTPKVQPLDEHNEVKHKLTTSVRLDLKIDGMPFIVERSLKEDWSKPRGTTELVCKGTKSEYAINEVPMSKTQYNAKLEEIAPLDKWFLLSAVGIIPNMDQKACRAELQAIAPAFDERTIAQTFPAVLEALNKGLNVDELQATTKRQKTLAQQELGGIPAAIDAQDRLRMEDDWSEIENQLQATKVSIAHAQSEIESLQTASVNETALQQAAAQRQVIARLSQQVSDRQLAIHNSYHQQRSKAEQEMQNIAAETDSIARRLEISRQNSQHWLSLINEQKNCIAALREQWKAKNAETYTAPVIETTCPTCGQPLSPERITEAHAKAEQVWNEAKTASLHAIQAEAEACKQRIDMYAVSDAEEAKKDAADKARLEILQQNHTTAEQTIAAIRLPEVILAEDKTYQTLLFQLQEATAAAMATQQREDTTDTQAAIMQYKADIANLTKQQETLLRRLAARDTNERIATERARLEERQRELADIIAQAEGVEQQIQAYRKAKITAVENGVSSLFRMVHWKMYEPNITNDGEREICTALINGVPYEQQNRATQVNAGIDIVNAFAKAYQVSTPLFVDNAEAVTSLLTPNGQYITLEVVKNSRLTIN